MKISKEIEIDMGHAVTGHNSKCKHLHGHRYRIVAFVHDTLIADPESSSFGMVIDFGDLKKAMMYMIDEPFDHAFVIWKEDPRAQVLWEAHTSWHNDPGKFHLLEFVPTAENLARYWFRILGAELKAAYNIQLEAVHVYETPTSCAIYTREEFEMDESVGDVI